jgi:transposase
MSVHLRPRCSMSRASARSSPRHCSSPGRTAAGCAPEACFARLAGVAPLPASSGQATRHRLSRGGDRQLNRALHTIVLHRRQHEPTTKSYIAKRIAEGKSRRDATRLFKRYLRHPFTGYCKIMSRSWLDRS